MSMMIKTACRRKQHSLHKIHFQHLFAITPVDSVLSSDATHVAPPSVVVFEPNGIAHVADKLRQTVYHWFTDQHGGTRSGSHTHRLLIFESVTQSRRFQKTRKKMQQTSYATDMLSREPVAGLLQNVTS